jgi:hypothetical protein
MKIEQTVYETVPPGRYNAKLVEVTEDQGNWGLFVKLTFELEDPQYDGVNVTGAASAKFSSRSKLYKWCRALFGRQIPKTYTLDTADLVGRRCELGLEIVEDDGTEFNRIESIYPIRAAQPAPAPAPAPVTDDAAWPEDAPPGFVEENEIPF